MLPHGGRVGAAVSGGADSVVLLHLLERLAGRFGVELIVLHVNHHLRGEESDGDESFVRALAESLDLPFVSKQSFLGAGNLEGEARRQRREFFSECRKSHGLSRIALGHTRSDQAETVLHRFLRGTGPTGLAAMRPLTRDGFIRPLLTTSREEVRQWAEREGLRWREDSSNEDLRFTRNRLRQQTLPALAKDFNPNLESTLASTAALAQAEEDYWTGEVDRLYPRITRPSRFGSIFTVEGLNALPLAVRRRLIRRALAEIRPGGLTGLDFEHIEAILALCGSDQGHERVLVPGADALRSFEWLLLSAQGRLGREPRGYRVPISLGEIYDLPFDAGRICLNVVTRRQQPYDSFKKARKVRIERVQLEGQDLTERPLTVRNWEPGDELHRSGHQSAEKVKTLFQEHRVRLWERRHWPVLLCGDEIVWVRHFGAAEQFQPIGLSSQFELVYGAEE